MGTNAVAEIKIAAQRYALLGDTLIRLEIHFFVFYRTLKALDKDVIAPGSLAAHADRNVVLLR